VCARARAVITCPWLWTESLQASCAQTTSVAERVSVCVCVCACSHNRPMLVRKPASWMYIICACKAEKYCCVCMCVCMCACVRVCVCACSHNRPMLVDRKSVSWLCIICACKAEKYCCVCVCARAVITCPWLWTASLRADCASSARVKQKNIGVCVCVQS